MTDYKHFPRLIGREYRRKRSTKLMTIVTAIIILAVLLVLSAARGHEQKAVEKAKAEERAYMIAHWNELMDKAILTKAQEQAKRVDFE